MQANSIKIGSFKLSFPVEINFETFEDPGNCYGVIFRTNEYRYQVLDSKLGTRIFVNGREGEVRDMPFNEGTARWLPECIVTVRTE